MIQSCTERRSVGVTALRIGAPHGTRLRNWTAQQAGVTLGLGLGMGTPEDPASDGFFRIGHMGDHDVPRLQRLLAALE